MKRSEIGSTVDILQASVDDGDIIAQGHHTFFAFAFTDHLP